MYVSDASGNVEIVLDRTQAVYAAYRYDPFGTLIAKRGSTQPFGFSTKRTDTATGLVYFGARWYAPHLGRWMTKDPLGEAGGLNLYAYVGNNPVNWVDPWGLASGGASSLDTSVKSCVEDLPDIQKRIQCLKDLLDFSKNEGINDPQDLQQIYTSIAKQHQQTISGFKGFTKDMCSRSETMFKGDKIDKVKTLVERFGGRAKDWVKRKGWDASGKEWHWYENQSIGKIGVKPAGAPDPWYLQ